MAKKAAKVVVAPEGLWRISVDVDCKKMDYFEGAKKLQAAIGLYSDGSGVGFGRWDAEWYGFKTREEAEKAAAKLKRFKFVEDVEITRYRD